MTPEQIDQLIEIARDTLACLRWGTVAFICGVVVFAFRGGDR